MGRVGKKPLKKLDDPGKHSKSSVRQFEVPVDSFLRYWKKSLLLEENLSKCG